MKALCDEAEQASLEAARDSSDVPMKKKDLEMYAQVFVSVIRGANGTSAEELLSFWEKKTGAPLAANVRAAIGSQLEPMAAMLKQLKVDFPELDGDDLMARVQGNEDPNLNKHAPGKFVQRALRNAKRTNITRNSKPSDLVDLAHVQYLPYVDFMTTDRENVSILKPLAAKVRQTRASRLLRVGRLRLVAEAIEEIAAKRQ